MFSKLSFDELSKFYSAISILESSYGKKAVAEALENMSKQLDESARKQTEHYANENQITIFDVTEEEKVEHKKPDPKPIVSDQKVKAEKQAKESGFDSLDDYLIYHYYIKGYNQYIIADMLSVGQRTISKWLSLIPQKKIREYISEHK